MSTISGKIGQGLSYSFEPTSVEGPETVRGCLKFNSDSLPEVVDTKGIADVLESDEENQAIRLQLARESATQNSIRIQYQEDYHYIPMLSAPSYYIVESLLSGNTDSAVPAFKEYYGGKRSIWELRSDCRDSLGFRPFADVINRLAELFASAEHVQFRTALGYFAKRILEKGPQGIESFETLQQRVEYWNSCEHLTEVNLAEVIAEKLGRNSYRDGISTEREDLDRIGYDPVTFDPEWETVAPAAWLSHMLVTQGVVRAEQFVENRNTPQNIDYNTLKQRAFDAEYGSREQRWGQAMSLAAVTDNADVRYCMYQYLRWTARDCRTKGKFVPLLYRGAVAALPQHMSAKKEQNLRTKRFINIGHNWRRDVSTQDEIDAFEIAKELARAVTEREYEFSADLFVKAEASLTHAYGKSVDDSNRCKNVYQTGINKIIRLSDEGYIDEDLASKKTEFLRDKMQ